MTRRMLPLILAGAFALGFTHAAVTTDQCRTLDVSEGVTSYAVAQQLQARGWYGVQADGVERLYSPECAS